MSNALAVIAQNSGTSPDEIKEVLSGMIISAKAQHGAKATDAELAVVAGVCATYSLNPLVKEAYAFISGGKLQVMIGIDGWLKVMTRHPEFDGIEYDYEWNGKDLVSVTAKIYTKSRSRPVCVTEWLEECRQPKSDAWNKYPRRMLRNKATGQCVRVAFGISEILDDDEAERIKSSERDVTPQQSRAVVDYQAIELQMSECGDLEMLKQLCTSIREDMDKRGIWNSEKTFFISLNKKHKARIESYASSINEFEEVIEVENEQQDAIESTETTVEF